MNWSKQLDKWLEKETDMIISIIAILFIIFSFYGLLAVKFKEWKEIRNQEQNQIIFGIKK